MSTQARFLQLPQRLLLLLPRPLLGGVSEAGRQCSEL
jgi:hypothetical protein